MRVMVPENTLIFNYLGEYRWRRYNDLTRLTWCLEKVASGVYTVPRVAPIAQLVEHFIRNEGVFGSNPDWGTRILLAKSPLPNAESRTKVEQTGGRQ